MSIYDDKTEGIIESDGRFVLPIFMTCSEATFKASYVVASDMKCTGKVTALFDLTVLGDVEAVELDVKGKFICTGKCVISGILIAQYGIWVNDIRAQAIESRDRIIAQEIDADEIEADGDIVVGKCLAIKKLAHSDNNIICGETAYGAGKIVANIVITGEPIDLDNGADAVVNPNEYNTSQVETPILVADNASTVSAPSDFASSGDWLGYLDWLIEDSVVESEKARFAFWKATLSKVDGLVRNGITGGLDLKLLIWTLEIACSDYFSSWLPTQSLLAAMDKHFASLVQTDKASIICCVESYSELLHALDILNRYGAFIDRTVYEVAFEMLISNFGLKSKFVTERLNEKGWKAYD